MEDGGCGMEPWSGGVAVGEKTTRVERLAPADGGDATREARRSQGARPTSPAPHEYQLSQHTRLCRHISFLRKHQRSVNTDH